jgi:hypothetical protein
MQIVSEPELRHRKGKGRQTMERATGEVHGWARVRLSMQNMYGNVEY